MWMPGPSVALPLVIGERADLLHYAKECLAFPSPTWCSWVRSKPTRRSRTTCDPSAADIFLAVWHHHTRGENMGINDFIKGSKSVFEADMIQSQELKITRSTAVATRKPIVLYTSYGIAAEQNRRKCRIWNSHGHMTTLLIAIPDEGILAVRFFTVCCGWTIHSTAEVSEEVNRKCPPR